MADRQQHIDTLADAIYDHGAAAIFDSTDPAVHDALTAALHANADRAQVLAAHADHGWLDKVPGHYLPATRYVSTWDPE